MERVLGAVGVYDALGLHPSVEMAEVRKVYRKTCLLVHPDKCKHARATEAFQQLGTYVIELEKLEELGGSGTSTKWADVHKRATETHEWVEGSDCGSWGGESSDEDGVWHPVASGEAARAKAIAAGIGRPPEPSKPPPPSAAPALEDDAPQPQPPQPQQSASPQVPTDGGSADSAASGTDISPGRQQEVKQLAASATAALQEAIQVLISHGRGEAIAWVAPEEKAAQLQQMTADGGNGSAMPQEQMQMQMQPRQQQPQQQQQPQKQQQQPQQMQQMQQMQMTMQQQQQGTERELNRSAPLPAYYACVLFFACPLGSHTRRPSARPRSHRRHDDAKRHEWVAGSLDPMLMPLLLLPFTL